MRWLIVYVLLVIGNSLSAQQLLLSPEEYLSSNNAAVKVVGTVGDKTVCFVENSNSYELLWYDSLMRKLAVSRLDFLEKGAEKFTFYTSDEAAYVFYQRKKRRVVHLMAAVVRPVDRDTIIPKVIDSLELHDAWDKTRFRFFNTHLANRFVYGKSSYKNRDDKLSFSATVLDNNLYQVSSASAEMNDVVFHDLLNIVLDKNDGIHVLYGEPTSRYEQLQNVLIGSKSPQSREMNFNKLDLRSYNIGDGRIAFNVHNGKIYLVGLLYQQDYRTVAAIGGFVYNPIVQKWETSNFTTIYGDGSMQQGLLSNMRMRKLMLKRNGDYSVILEKSFEETYQRNRSIGFVSPGFGMGSSSYDVYHNDEILVFDIKKSGTINWYETIVKVQETTDASQRYQSYGQLQSALGNVFLFNDQNNGNNRFINAFLSNDGELHLKQFTARGGNSISESGMMLRNATQTGANEIVFPVVKRGTLSFAKIVY